MIIDNSEFMQMLVDKIEDMEKRLSGLENFFSNYLMRKTDEFNYTNET